MSNQREKSIAHYTTLRNLSAAIAIVGLISSGWLLFQATQGEHVRTSTAISLVLCLISMLALYLKAKRQLRTLTQDETP